MNGLIKQLFTPNSPVARLSEHKTEDLGLNPRGFAKISSKCLQNEYMSLGPGTRCNTTVLF